MAEPADDTYLSDLAAWRAQQEAALRAPDGWLSLAGLFWLAEGSNPVGSHQRSSVLLAADAAPAHAGELCLHDGVVTIGAAGAALQLNGGPAEGRPLLSDDSPTPDILGVGRLSMLIIRRGPRIGVRVRDPQHPARAAFAGRRWHAPRPDYRLTARFEPYDPPRSLPITNILGDTEAKPSPGALVFSLEGRELRLDATAGPRGGLALNFRDRTSGATTYGAGRMLTTPSPRDGLVVLDFNRAVSPPCAFTAFATCPLPPFQNHLPVAIPAGELALAEAHEATQ